MIQAKKSLGQNFLMHRQTAERIVLAAQLPPQSHVLEIGPGTGMLTRALLVAGHTVTAIEADVSLVPALSETFAAEIAANQLVIHQGDARDFATTSLATPFHIVANIPYYITGELFRHFLTATPQPASMTFLVQKEVAERITRAKKGSLLSLSIQAFGTPTYCFTVPRGAFLPAPKVDSAVLHIADITRNAFVAGTEDAFFALLHAGFAHKRKRLAKNLESLYPVAVITAAFSSLSLDPNIRAEDLSLKLWLALLAELTTRSS